MDTVIVRIWRPATPTSDELGEDGMHGVARHVATGRVAAFTDGPALLELLAEWRSLGRAVDGRTSDDRDRT
jgi:hypothetical protein